MSLFRAARALGDTTGQLVPARGTSLVGSVSITPDNALRSSAVWACQRLRADLVSTLPIDSYRKARTEQGTLISIEMGATPFLLDPAGDGFGVEDWLYSSQFDLDRFGNAFGLVVAVDALGNPAVVQLVDTATVTVTGNGSTITGYRIGGKPYEPSQVWHERAFTVPGNPLGLSPIAYAAVAIGSHLSAQAFAVDWFRNGAQPAGRLKNTAKTIAPEEAAIAKTRFKAAVANRDIFVHGTDWEYDVISITADESQFLDTMKFSINDIARFYGVPGDMIDAPTDSTAKITYANITQRNLQMLVMNLDPTLKRRERKLSSALPKPRFVKFNRNAFLAMDPQTASAMLGAQINSRQIAPSEARAIMDRAPFTDEQLAEFDRLFGKGQPAPGKSEGVPA